MSGPSSRGLASVVRFVTRFPRNLQEIDPDLDPWSRYSLLDTLSVLVAGTVTTLGQAVRRAAAEETGAARVPGTGLRTTPTWAAVAGASAASALDFDDGHYAGGGIHPGSTIVPVLLAGAESELPLSTLRAAMVAGYEIAIRVGRLASPAVSRSPYRGSGFAAAVGATAALCSLHAASREVTSAALRIALAHAPVAEMVSEGAREASGWAAATALGAFRLAAAGAGAEAERANGVAGPLPVGPTIFDVHEADPMMRTLGLTHECLACYTKPYPCCRAAHAAIDALRSLADRHGWDTIRDSSLRIGVAAGASILDRRDPATLAQAQYSIPFVLAVLAVRGVAGLGALGVPNTDDAVLRDPDVRAFAERVVVTHVAELDGNPWPSYPAVVELGDAAGGAIDVVRIEHASGSVHAPLSVGLRLEKAHALLSRVLAPNRVAELMTLVTELDGTSGDLQRLSMATRETGPAGRHRC